MTDRVAIKTHSGDSHIIPLSPCPFCGSPAEFLEYEKEGLWGARCTKCSCVMVWYSSRLDLCNDWNKRTVKEDQERC
jgi:hypothetical protein